LHPEESPDQPGAVERIRIVGESLPFEHPLLAAAVAVALVAVAAFAFLRPEPPPVELSLPQAEPGAAVGAEAEAEATPSRLTVHAAGAVRNPGVYELEAGARVADLLELAGGALPEADLDSLNLAEPLADGTQVLVLRRGEAVPAGAAAAGADRPAAKVNLNTASAADLEALPGIGPATAEAIIRHREEKGRFRSVSDLLDVRGIGEAKLSKLRPLVTV
jgi:competence protein ComEA